MSNYIEQPPRVEAWINQICNEPVRHHIAIGEVIDNAFDAGATFVMLEFDTKRGVVTVRDNGNGCPTPNVVITPGERHQHRTTRLGRYGIGAKIFLFFYGGPDHKVTVESVTPGGTKYIARVDWKWAKQENRWRVEMLSPVPEDPSRHGTIIEVKSPDLRSLPAGKKLDEMLEELEFTYSRALRGVTNGVRRTIVIAVDGKARQLEGWEPPVINDSIDQIIEVRGRKARVRAGLVADGAINKRSGLTYFYDYRTIIGPTSKGCGDYDKSRFCGFVELLGTWPLTKNKDGLSRDEDELYDEVLRVCEPVLKKAASAAHFIESRSLNEKAQEYLDKITGHAPPDAKAKRSTRTGDKPGTVEGTGDGPGHKRANVEQPGRTFKSKSRSTGRTLLGSRIRMSFEDRGADEPAIGVDLRGRTVECNVSHPWVAASRSHPEEMAKHALWAWSIAFSLSRGDANQLTFETRDVFKTFTSAMSDFKVDGRPR